MQISEEMKPVLRAKFPAAPGVKSYTVRMRCVSTRATRTHRPFSVEYDGSWVAIRRRQPLEE